MEINSRMKAIILIHYHGFLKLYFKIYIKITKSTNQRNISPQTRVIAETFLVTLMVKEKIIAGTHVWVS